MTRWNERMEKDELYDWDTYTYLRELFQEGLDVEALAFNLASWMGQETLQACLDAQELSPRFVYEIEED